jgi:hypothetical protein
MPRAKRPGTKGKPAVSGKQRASDDELRETLRTADLGKFAKGLAKAIRPTRSR